jgi:multimeric flavodoxin WrbA/nitrite reductase/ring-hydroxylating ferredoxin subunit
MAEAHWHDLGPIEPLKSAQLQQIMVGRVAIALSYKDGKFGAVSGRCSHAGGPIGDGSLRGDYIVCPWHYWTYHRITGDGEPGFEDTVPRFDIEEREGHLFVNLTPASKRHHSAHEPHPLTRDIRRTPGPLRVVGISTTSMDRQNPRYSTSEALLDVALDHARARGAESKLIRLNELKFRTCEGFYSKGAGACTWPCSITQMDSADEMTAVYEAFVHWADVALVATPIRWGNASSLYFKMVERMNCIQNQITLHDRVLIRDKVAAFIITGGQDNIQQVAGEMLMFFGEIGFLFPQFPFIAHSRGWTAEDMEQNVATVQASEELRDGSRALVARCLDMAAGLIAAGPGPKTTERGGRKANKA